ncbi:hypothetical protein ADUPG1_004288, partial [Aduncisulcus paluster]
MLSTSPSLVPLLSPKYDSHMAWCKDNGGDWRSYCSKYCTNYSQYLKKLEDLVKLVSFIKKCPDSESTSKLYHEHRDGFLSVFRGFESKSEIKGHKKEIVLCAQCLRWFVRHDISRNAIFLPIPDLNDLIDTFI